MTANFSVLVFIYSNKRNVYPSYEVIGVILANLHSENQVVSKLTLLRYVILRTERRRDCSHYFL